MPSDSSHGAALVTNASTELGRAISLRLAKDFDIVINDLPEALKPLEVLKAQIENEGRKCAISVGDPKSDSAWTIIRSNVEERSGRPLEVGYVDGSLGYLGKTQAGLSKSLQRSGIWTAELSSNHPGAKCVEVYTKNGIGGHRALNFVIMDKECSVERSGSGAVGSLKSAICGLTEAAAAELGAHGITVNSYVTRGRHLFPPLQLGLCTKIDNGKKRKGAMYDLDKNVDDTAADSVEMAEDVADVVSFLTSKSARFITGHTFGV